MTDDELSKELADAVANQDKLEHVETKATPSEVALKLKCQTCDEMQDFPACDNCEVQMELSDDGQKLTCATEGCGGTKDVPAHHDKLMVPFVVKA